MPEVRDWAAEATPTGVSPVFNVLMVGVGGQGIILASDILAEAAMLSGLDAKKSEVHGMSQRGGPVFSHVRFGPEVHSPVIGRGEADVVYSLERMELLRWAPWARPGAAAVYADTDLFPGDLDAYPAGLDDEIAARFWHVVRFDMPALRAQINPKAKNTVLLGAVSVLAPLPTAAYEAAIGALVPAGTADVNLAGFEIGRRIAADALGVRLDEAAPAASGTE
ncbi:MAG TPA: indolepyruvate oxidoreductase subunit beta [Propionibacteriaceae bacterium]|jgi:indolepyruvate ferredoxin oxidoreductase beta subunit|nr:indolepyruvate oxidoreductase subunit beta [Propionibacteriaceae bacterium]HBY22136.1 indolepyruvate oxidoreductase subunit beta [Propionibacteriaceae bacterium]